MTRISTLFCLLTGLFLLFAFCAPDDLHAAAPRKIPVIYDSDIGDDIDDTWALAFLLRCPELDVKLVVGDFGKADYRAKLMAKVCETAGRTDVPVGVGMRIKGKGGDGRQAEWVKDYKLSSYPGKVYPDGVQAIIDIIMKSPEPITLICVGPLPNIRKALEKEPRIAKRARFIGMHGSVRLGYGGSKNISSEWNVRADVKSCQAVFTAPWNMTITPLDTCGLVHLTGDNYKAMFNSKDPLARAVIENYRIWAKKQNLSKQFPVRSSTLFDTVAVYLAYSQKLVTMETLKLKVDGKGYTRIDPSGKAMKVATAWKDMAAFDRLLVKRLTRKGR